MKTIEALLYMIIAAVSFIATAVLVSNTGGLSDPANRFFMVLDGLICLYLLNLARKALNK